MATGQQGNGATGFSEKKVATGQRGFQKKRCQNLATGQQGNGGFRKSVATLPHCHYMIFFENLYSLRFFFKLTKNYEKMIKSSNTITKNGNRATGQRGFQKKNVATGQRGNSIFETSVARATGQRGNEATGQRGFWQSVANMWQRGNVATLLFWQTPTYAVQSLYHLILRSINPLYLLCSL